MRSLRGLALHEAFDTLLAEHNRIAIVGGPKVGKTTLCRRVNDRPVFGTDSLMGLPWSEAPHAIIDQCQGITRFVVEGVQTARALRKGLRVDCIVQLTKVHQELSQGQASMTKGIATIMASFDPTAPVVKLT